jgi:ribosomal protein S18 acetylase RimI-like enzyme
MDMSTALITLYLHAQDYFFRGIASKCLDLEDAAHAYMTGATGLNFMYIIKNTNTLDKILIQGEQFFAQDGLSFEVIIPQELCTSQMRDVLKAMDYVEKDQSVAMGVDLEKFSFDQSATLHDETVIKTTDDQLNDWMIPLIGAFDSTFEICLTYATTHDLALKKHINLRHFSLYKHAKPIASLTLSMCDHTLARIDDVSTLPEFQGNGYASALMRHAVSAAKKLGARHCFLEASDAGLGVYQKLGFEPLFKNDIYSRRV